MMASERDMDAGRQQSKFCHDNVPVEVEQHLDDSERDADTVDAEDNSRSSLATSVRESMNGARRQHLRPLAVPMSSQSLSSTLPSATMIVDEPLSMSPPSPPTLTVSFSSSISRGFSNSAAVDDDDDDDGNMSPSSISSGHESLSSFVGVGVDIDDDVHVDGIIPFLYSTCNHNTNDRQDHPQQLILEMIFHDDHHARTATPSPSYRSRAGRKLEGCEHRASPSFHFGQRRTEQGQEQQQQQQQQQRQRQNEARSPTTTATPPPSSSTSFSRSPGLSSTAAFQQNQQSTYRWQIQKSSSSSVTFFGPQKIFMMICFSMLLLMSFHDDRINTSLGAQHGRREEVVDFPLVVARASAGSVSASTILGHDSATETLVDTEQQRLHQQRAARADLPKYYITKQQVGGLAATTAAAPDSVHNDIGGGLRLRQRHTNLAMARASEHVRPIFGQQQHPAMSKFYIDESDNAHRTIVYEGHGRSEQHYHQSHPPKSFRRKFWSFIAWVSTISLLSLVLDAGWKEYQRSRNIQEEQRRL